MTHVKENIKIILSDTHEVTSMDFST